MNIPQIWEIYKGLELKVETFQIKDEMHGALDFLKHVYQTFGFTYQLKLSTRWEHL